MSGTEDRSNRTIERDGRWATTRRQFLRQMVGVTGGAALAPILAACADGGACGSHDSASSAHGGPRSSDSRAGCGGHRARRGEWWW